MGVRERTVRAAVSLILVLGAVFVTQTPKAAEANHTLNIIHTPLANGRTSGSDVTINANVTTACAPWCQAVEFSVHWMRGDGTSGVITEIGDQAPSQIFSVIVPGNEIRWPDFDYWVEARQWWCNSFMNCFQNPGNEGSGHWYEARSPSTGTYSPTVDNRVRVRFVDPSNASLEGGSWWLNVETPQGDDEVSVSSGTVPPDGWVTLELPATTAVLAAAAANVHYANFIIRVRANDTAGGPEDRLCKDEMMYALYDADWDSGLYVPTAGVGGIEEDKSIITQECPPTDCQNNGGQPINTQPDTEDYDQGVFGHKVGTIHTGYDMKTTIHVNEGSSSTIDVGFRAASGTWSGSGNGSRQVKAGDAEASWSAPRDDYRTRTDDVLMGFHKVIRRTESWVNPCPYWWPPENCDVPQYNPPRCTSTALLLSRGFDPGWGQEHINTHYSNVNDDACLDCSANNGSFDGPYGVVNQGGTVTAAYLVNEAKKFQGMVCYIVCVGGSTGYHKKTKVMFDASNTTKCPIYRYYEPGTSAVKNAKEVFVDPGNPGPTTGSQGQPAGCSP